MTTKRCLNCRQTQPLDAFAKQGSLKRQDWCRACMQQYQATHARVDPAMRQAAKAARIQAELRGAR